MLLDASRQLDYYIFMIIIELIIAAFIINALFYFGKFCFMAARDIRQMTKETK